MSSLLQHNGKIQCNSQPDVHRGQQEPPALSEEMGAKEIVPWRRISMQKWQIRDSMKQMCVKKPPSCSRLWSETSPFLWEATRVLVMAKADGKTKIKVWQLFSTHQTSWHQCCSSSINGWFIYPYISLAHPAPVSEKRRTFVCLHIVGVGLSVDLPRKLVKWKIISCVLVNAIHQKLCRLTG